MSAREIARQWFVPGEGIDRHIISTNIQRYLGNDATVRPGKGTGEDSGVDGYWIKAYRNLTSAMVADLRADSTRYRQELRASGPRGRPDRVNAPSVGFAPPDKYTEPYSSAAPHPPAARPGRRDDDSPRAPEYGLPSARERVPPNGRGPLERGDRPDHMDLDGPPLRSGPMYPQPDRGYPPEARPIYSPDGRPYPPEPMPSGPNYPGRIQQPPSASPYGPPHGPPPPSDYPPNFPVPSHEIPPQGYPRPGAYYVPVSSPSSYDGVPPIAGRPEPPYGMNHPYNGAPTNPGREPPRYGQPPDYQDPRYAYPSPATTVSSVAARDRDREHNSGAPPPQPRFPQSANNQPYDRADNDSAYGPGPAGQFDQYGRPLAPPGHSVPAATAPPTTFPKSGNNRRSSTMVDSREPQRRRL